MPRILTCPLQDYQVREVIPNILGGFVGNMESLFARLTTYVTQNDSILHQISSAITMARRIVEAAKATISDY